MRLRIVSNLAQRPINNLEVLFRFVFGDKFPSVFEPGKEYQKGDIIVTIDENGNPKVIQCLITGTYTKDDLKDPSIWGVITILDVITGGTIEEIQKIVGNLNDYIGGDYPNVIEITNALYNKVENLINNFPDHDSEIDGGYFTEYIPEPEPGDPPTTEDIEKHNTSSQVHQNLIVDGNMGGNVLVEEIEYEKRITSNSLLIEHNNNPNAHNNIIIDGNI